MQKLLALAASSNVHEAALAAEQAQRVIDEHRLSPELLATDDEERRDPQQVEGEDRETAEEDT